MKKLTVKNIPDELYEKLKERATRNHRTISDEIVDILEKNFPHSKAPVVEAWLEKAAKLRLLTEHYVITDEKLIKFKNEGRE